MRALHNQGGWAGIIALLLVVLVIAFLASGTLKQYGLLQWSPTNAGAGAQRDRDEGKAPVDQGDVSPRDAMERVRQLQNAVKKQAEDIDARIDRSSK